MISLMSSGRSSGIPYTLLSFFHRNSECDTRTDSGVGRTISKRSKWIGPLWLISFSAGRSVSIVGGYALEESSAVVPVHTVSFACNFQKYNNACRILVNRKFEPIHVGALKRYHCQIQNVSPITWNNVTPRRHAWSTSKNLIMARGPTTHAPSPVGAALPKVEYEIAKDDVFKLPAGVFDGQARGYGCGYHL